MSELDYDLGTDQPGLYALYSGNRYYPNMESYPGQLNVLPPIQTMATEVRRNRKQAVKAVRAAERTQEHIRGGIDRKVNMVVGSNLRVQAQVDWELLGLTQEQGREIGRQFQLNFRDWAYEPRALADSEGHYDFGGLMWLAFRNYIAADAETFGIIHFDDDRRLRYNGRWATHLQILDPQRVNTPPDKVDDRNVFEGRQLDGHGRMIGFYLQEYAPETLESLGTDYTFIPREAAGGRPYGFHFFKKTRAGQHRGLSSLVTVLKHSTMLDKFDDAQLASAALNAMFAMYVKSDATPEAMGAQLNPAKGDTLDPRVEFYKKNRVRFGTNRLAILPPMDELVIEAVNRAAQDTDAFVNQFLRKFAVALDIPFELLAGNYSNANYSSIRAALVDAWRSVLAERGLFFRHVPALVYSVICEEAIARGRVNLPEGAPPFEENRAAYTRCMFVGPPMGWVDPKREAEATKIRLDSRITSHEKEIMDSGEDIDDVFDDWGRAIELADDNGFELIPPTGPIDQQFSSDADPDQEVDADPHADINDRNEPPTKKAPAQPPAKKERKKKEPAK